MSIKGLEKTSAKTEIMKLLSPWLRENGFQCVQGGKTGGIFVYTVGDASLELTIQAPTFDSFFRMSGSWKKGEATVAHFEYSDRNQYPDEHGVRNYNFRFHRSKDSHQRCADNMKRWILNELMPWFKTRPQESWYSHRAS